MSPLSREDLIELGVSFPTRSLTDWSSGQLAATKGRETRLETRGMSAAHLSGIRDLVAIVEKRQHELGESHELPPQVVALAQRLRQEALAYWREAKQMAKVEFAAQPDLLARFRPGVRTGLLIAALIKELETAVPLLREHSAQLAPLGANAAFLERGELLITRLKEVKQQLDAACRALPSPVDQHCHDKGLLYDLTRKLVRVGRLEFMLDPGQASHFNFTGVRQERGVSTLPRLKKTSASGRS
jgi:hypothetical protein